MNQKSLPRWGGLGEGDASNISPIWLRHDLDDPASANTKLPVCCPNPQARWTPSTSLAAGECSTPPLRRHAKWRADHHNAIIGQSLVLCSGAGHHGGLPLSGMSGRCSMSRR